MRAENVLKQSGSRARKSDEEDGTIDGHSTDVDVENAPLDPFQETLDRNGQWMQRDEELSVDERFQDPSRKQIAIFGVHVHRKGVHRELGRVFAEVEGSRCGHDSLRLVRNSLVATRSQSR